MITKEKFSGDRGLHDMGGGHPVMSLTRAVMEKKRINIAYMTADWNRELISVALATVVKFLERHSEVHIQVFDCFSFSVQRQNESRLPDL